MEKMLETSDPRYLVMAQIYFGLRQDGRLRAVVEASLSSLDSLCPTFLCCL